MNRLTYLFASACLLAGCASGPKDQIMDTSLTLLPKASAPLSRSASLRYDGISDSRCPPNATCIWAGDVRHTFTLSSSSGNESFGLNPEHPEHAAKTIPGLKITLGQTDPAPLPAVGTPFPVAPVTVHVTTAK